MQEGQAVEDGEEIISLIISESKRVQPENPTALAKHDRSRLAVANIAPSGDELLNLILSALNHSNCRRQQRRLQDIPTTAAGRDERWRKLIIKLVESVRFN